MSFISIYSIHFNWLNVFILVLAIVFVLLSYLLLFNLYFNLFYFKLFVKVKLRFVSAVFMLITTTLFCISWFLSPLHKPLSGSPSASRWQRSPLMWSQGSVGLQSWLNCLAQTRQQPQWSKTELMPGGHEGGAEGQEHFSGHPPCTWGHTHTHKTSG